MATTVHTPGLVLVEHELEVPLDHANPGGPKLTLFAREVAEPDGRDKPFLVFLQGGPGHEAVRPTAKSPGWLERALRDFRVLLLDQRGTGRSSPVGPAHTDPEYLAHFRADAIVRDCELLRQALGVDRWSVLGQSFGGLCVHTYLSLAPDGLREALVTGGVPVLGERIDDVYRATYATLADRTRQYYERYPADRARVLALHERLAAEDVRLPCGDRLTSRRLRQLGGMLGMSDGADNLHYILELPADSPAFLHSVDTTLEFARNPLYALVHEACWADGGTTRWSADRLLPDLPPESFTGEHVYPWMFEEYGALSAQHAAADALAAREWGRLYDPEQLARNTVPVAAAVYAHDMYVDRRLSEETAAQVGGMRVWLTSELEHNGLRADGARVLDHLLDLVRGRA